MAVRTLLLLATSCAFNNHPIMIGYVGSSEFSCAAFFFSDIATGAQVTITAVAASTISFTPSIKRSSSAGLHKCNVYASKTTPAIRTDLITSCVRWLWAHWMFIFCALMARCTTLYDYQSNCGFG